MPRKSSRPTHPLRTIRIAAKLSQEKFAKKLGVSKDTILSIECGRLKMSNELALKVKFHTGCQIKSERNSDGRLEHSITTISDQTLGEYTHEDFEQHEQMRSESAQIAFASSVRGAGRSVDLLLRAAQRRSLATAQSVRVDLERFIVRIFADYDLSAFLEGLFREECAQEEGLNAAEAVKSFASVPLVLSLRFRSRLEFEAHQSARVLHLRDLVMGSPDRSISFQELADRHSFTRDEVRRLAESFPDSLEICEKPVSGKKQKPPKWLKIPNRAQCIKYAPLTMPPER